MINTDDFFDLVVEHLQFGISEIKQWVGIQTTVRIPTHCLKKQLNISFIMIRLKIKF